MGDSGALVLGFLLAAVSVQGLLKTAATVVLFLPLLVLAVPILDTSFVVARRLKHGSRLRRPTRRTSTTASCGAASRSGGRRYDVGVVRDARRRGARHAVHPLPRRRRVAPAGRRSPSPRSALVALVFSVYVVYVLEIVKLNIRAASGGGGERSASDVRRPSRDEVLGRLRHPGPSELRRAAARA